jgi:hypothetical protein
MPYDRPKRPNTFVNRLVGEILIHAEDAGEDCPPKSTFYRDIQHDLSRDRRPNSSSAASAIRSQPPRQPTSGEQLTTALLAP